MHEALDNYNRAMQLFRLTGDKGGEADTINNIGAAYNDLGDTKRGLENYNLALALYKQIDDKDGQATALHNIGSAYNDMGDHQKALEHYELALALNRQIGSKSGEVANLNNLGAVYDGLGQKGRAMELFVRSLEIVREIGDRSGEGLLLSNIGKILVDIDEGQKALGFYTQALQIQRQVGDKSGEAITLSNLMSDWITLGNSQLALFYGKQSVNTYQELRGNIKTLDKETQKTYRTTVGHVYRQVADLLIGQGQFAQAETVLAMLKEEEFFDFVRRDAGEIEKLDARVPLNEKEKALIAQYTSLAGKVSELGQAFIKLDDKKRQLSRNDLTLSADEQKQYDDLEKQLDTANAAFQLFVNKGLAAEIGKEKAKDIEIDRNLQSKLRQWGDGTVALYTIAGDDRYRVVLTTPKSQFDGKTEIKLADLNKKIFDFRSALQNPNIDPRPLGKELYDILVKPVEKELKAAKAKTLVWSLDGTLRYVPLAALSPDGKRYLVEDVQNVIITPKTRDDMSDSNAAWEALGLGVSEGQTVPDPDDKTRSIPFIALPGTETELASIIMDDRQKNEAGVLPGRRFMNKDFTVANFKDALAKENPDGTRRYNAVHIASHFKLGSNWSNSFLLVGNGGTLTLEDINNSSTIDFGGVDLITLSACNTGFADDTNGKEIDSLASVIQTKSGKAVLATLWAVADESTSLIMSEFYKLRKQDPKLTKAEAMQLAQKAMINGKLKSSGKAAVCRSDQVDLGDGPADFRCSSNAPFAHPYYWAPFVLIGNWR
jgi:CHAT domain-containing protein/tetratricopeptide (TPR) repeat protein